jgi:hypothetical protein
MRAASKWTRACAFDQRRRMDRPANGAETGWAFFVLYPLHPDDMPMEGTV